MPSAFFPLEYVSFSKIYLHHHKLSLDEPNLDQQGSYIDERQLIMWCCH